LVNTHNYRIEFFPEGCPSYAILSHRWIDGQEVNNLEEFLALRKKTRNKSGYQKVVDACKQARKDGHEYIWIDTCCISNDKDKRSRDIQNMYGFYKGSAVCYAYLADVELNFHHSCSLDPYHICLSDWFCRGWTLQELIAPEKVHFFGKAWNFVGSKSTLQEAISDRTLIPSDILGGEKSLEDVRFSTRMSWALGRVTTKPVDEAYCLMGILGVSLEPKEDEDVRKAFDRLWERCLESYPPQAGDIVSYANDVYERLGHSVQWMTLSNTILRSTRGRSLLR
ncbi:HET-domain-containing protein, partial [Dendrothele bispora CBS 962.96]